MKRSKYFELDDRDYATLATQQIDKLEREIADAHLEEAARLKMLNDKHDVGKMFSTSGPDIAVSKMLTGLLTTKRLKKGGFEHTFRKWDEKN